MLKKKRICRQCERTNEEVEFFQRKRVRKCGVYYQFENICIDCKRDENRYLSQDWNDKNRLRRRQLNKEYRERNIKDRNKKERIKYAKEYFRYCERS